MEIEKHLFNDYMFLILNNDGTQLRKNGKKIKPMIYHLPSNFQDKEEYKNCKVAIFELKEITTIEQMKQRGNIYE